MSSDLLDTLLSPAWLNLVDPKGLASAISRRVINMTSSTDHPTARAATVTPSCTAEAAKGRMSRGGGTEGLPPRLHHEEPSTSGRRRPPRRSDPGAEKPDAPLHPDAVHSRHKPADED